VVHISRNNRFFADTRPSPQGPSALARPANGWTDTRLGRVFGDPIAEKAKLSGGAIAGVIVGIIVALILIATGGWYAWQRWHTSNTTVQHDSAEPLKDWQAPDRGDGQPVHEQTNVPVVAT
jgi:hypothetical protein